MIEQQIIFSSYYDIDLDKQCIIHQTGVDVLNKYILATLDCVISKYDKCQLYEPLIPNQGYVYEKISEILQTIESIIPPNLHKNLDTLLQDNSQEVAVALDENISPELSSSFLTYSSHIANKLLSEKLRVNHGAVQIKQGALIQSIVITRHGYYYILLKNEFFRGISRNSLEEIQAFLYDTTKKKLPLKIAIFRFDLTDSNELILGETCIDDGIKSDHSPTWYESFLELKKCTNDSINTGNCANFLINMWDSVNIDTYTANEIRNTSIGYFFTHDEFDLDEYMDQIVTTFNLSDNQKTEALNKINTSRKKTRGGFDYKFHIMKDAIKDKYMTKKIYPIGSKITVSVLGKILPSDIKSFRSPEGNYLMIRTEDTAVLDAYNDFEI